MIDVLRFGFGKKELVKMTPEERTRDLENPSASVHLKRFSTPSLTLKFLCAGKLNPRGIKFTPEQTFVVGETLNIQWKAESEFLAEPYKGSDAYETHDGLIAAMVSTFKGTDLKLKK